MKKIIVQKEIKVEKCDKCDEYGTIRRLNHIDDPKSGYYSPFCDCEFGQWSKNHSDHRDMFCRARQGG